MERYSRQILFSPISEIGQKMLMKSSVLIVGVGALGTVISNHLVRSGIGSIRIVDRDYVELSNLQRQILFDENDAKNAKPKAVAAKEKLKQINSNVKIEAHIDHVTAKNIDMYSEDIDIIIDGTDNFQTRYLLNDIAYKKGVPFSYGGVVSSRGMSALFIPRQTPCLRCIIQHAANDGQTCDTVGVLGPAVQIVSSIQVTEVLKYLTDNPQQLNNSLISFDIWTNEFTKVKYGKPKSSCTSCQQEQYLSLQSNLQEEQTVLCGRNTVQIHLKSEMDLKEWEDRLSSVTVTNRTPFLLQANVDDELKFVIFKDGRVLVQGTEDVIKARTVYDRFIGS